MGEDMTTTQQFWLILFLGVIPFALIYYLAVNYFRKRFGRKHKAPAIDEIARGHLRAHGPIDLLKWYVVILDMDMGVFNATAEGTRTPEMLTCDSLFEAAERAEKSSHDSDDEVYAYVFSGDLACRMIFHSGIEVYRDDKSASDIEGKPK